jgi:hypothetical protein
MTPRAPTRDLDGILRELDELQADCRGQERKYLNAKGEERKKPEPDNRTALSCIELKAKLLGLLGDGKNLTFPEFERKCNELGYDLVPRKLRAVTK